MPTLACLLTHFFVVGVETVNDVPIEGNYCVPCSTTGEKAKDDESISLIGTAFTHLLTHSLTYSLTRSLAHSLTHSPTHSLIKGSMNSYSKMKFDLPKQPTSPGSMSRPSDDVRLQHVLGTHSRTHALTYSLTHLLTHSFKGSSNLMIGKH